jgi:hypothetical protein
MRKLNEHLRQALEEAKADSQPIAFKGPLGQAFTDALNQEYVKTDPEETKDGEESKPALESQQLQHNELAKIAALLTNGETPEKQGALYVYGVSQTDMTEDDIVNVAQDVAALSPAERENYVVIVQETPDTGEIETTVKELSGAMEAFTKALKVKTYPSLEAFAKARFS